MTDPTTSPAPAEPEPSALDLRRIVRRIGLLAVFAVVAGVALATLPGVGEVRDRLTSANRTWIAVAGLCSLASMAGFSVALWAAFGRAPRFRGALDLGIAEQG